MSRVAYLHILRPNLSETGKLSMPFGFIFSSDEVYNSRYVTRDVTHLQGFRAQHFLVNNTVECQVIHTIIFW